jgi:hypothetical protein
LNDFQTKLGGKMKQLLCFLFLMGVLAIAGAQTAKAEQCKVTDPTGTPLNLRASPNGRIVGKVRNGTIVYIERSSTDDNGRAWAKIGTYRRSKYVILGWVYREFISCY